MQHVTRTYQLGNGRGPLVFGGCLGGGHNPVGLVGSIRYRSGGCLVGRIRCSWRGDGRRRGPGAGSQQGTRLHFRKHILSARKEARVIATCRSPEAASALQALHRLYPRKLTVLWLDATREAEIREAAEAVAKEHGRLDQLINSGAMLRPGARETSLQEVSAEVTSCLRRKDMPPAGPHPMPGERSFNGSSITLATNTIGLLVMAKYFTPLLRKGTGAFGHQFADQAKQHRAILVNLTAKVGSTGDNGLHKIYNVNAFVCSQLSGIGVFRTAQAIIFQNVKKRA